MVILVLGTSPAEPSVLWGIGVDLIALVYCHEANQLQTAPL